MKIFNMLDTTVQISTLNQRERSLFYCRFQSRPISVEIKMFNFEHFLLIGCLQFENNNLVFSLFFKEISNFVDKLKVRSDLNLNFCARIRSFPAYGIYLFTVG